MKRSAVLLCFLTNFITCIAYEMRCALKTSEYEQAFNQLQQCALPNQTPEDTLILATFEDIDIRDCINNRDKQLCDDIITSYTSLSKPMQDIAATIVEHGSDACSCITSYRNSFDRCFAVLEEFNLYCMTFYADAGGQSDDPSNPSNPITGGSCQEAIETTCGASLSFDDTVSCLMTNYLTLEQVCESLLNTLISTVTSDCQSDLDMYCENSLISPVTTIACLVENIPSLSYSCREQLLNLAKSDGVPCAAEASYYCDSETDFESILQCLSSLDTAKLSDECSEMVSGYNNCRDADPHHPPDHHHHPGQAKRKMKSNTFDLSNIATNSVQMLRRSLQHGPPKHSPYDPPKYPPYDQPHGPPKGPPCHPGDDCYKTMSSQEKSALQQVKLSVISRKIPLSNSVSRSLQHGPPKDPPCWSKDFSAGGSDESTEAQVDNMPPPGPSLAMISKSVGFIFWHIFITKAALFVGFIVFITLAVAVAAISVGKRIYDRMNKNNNQMDTSSDGTPVHAVVMKTFTSRDNSSMYNPLPVKENI